MKVLIFLIICLLGQVYGQCECDEVICSRCMVGCSGVSYQCSAPWPSSGTRNLCGWSNTNPPAGVETSTRPNAWYACGSCFPGTYNPTGSQNVIWDAEINNQRPSTPCTDCNVGYWTPSGATIGADQSVCTVCAAGYYSSTGHASGTNTGCTACATGYSTADVGTVGTDASVCTKCGIGYYSSTGDASGMSTGCIACNVGETTSGVGTVSSSSTSACTNCAIGYYSTTGKPPGCTACPEGFSTPRAGTVGMNASVCTIALIQQSEHPTFSSAPTEQPASSVTSTLAPTLVYSAVTEGLFIAVTNAAATFPASAAACYVDSPNCGLLDAIELCKASDLEIGQVCRISISSSVMHITLTEQLIFPQAQFTWVVQGDMVGGKNTISRDVSNLNKFRVIKNHGNLRLKNIAITGGSVLNDAEGGGGILNLGTLALEDSILLINSAGKNTRAIPAHGAGVSNSLGAILTLSNVEFTNNQVHGGCSGGCYGSPANKGGAIYNAGSLVGGNVIFVDNVGGNHDAAAYGGAIYNEGSITLENTRFTRNIAADDLTGTASEKGGAVYQESGSSVFNVVVFEENKSGSSTPYTSGIGEAAGIFLQGGSMIINQGTFTGNDAIGKDSDNAYIVTGATLQFVNTFVPPLVVTGIVGSYTVSFECEAGFTVSAEEGASGCIACAAGKYKGTAGSAVCTSCDAGYTSVTRGDTAVVACNVCAIGMYSADGNGNGEGNNGCTACNEGYSTSGVGTSGSSAAACDVYSATMPFEVSLIGGSTSCTAFDELPSFNTTIRLTMSVSFSSDSSHWLSDFQIYFPETDQYYGGNQVTSNFATQFAGLWPSSFNRDGFFPGENTATDIPLIGGFSRVCFANTCGWSGNAYCLDAVTFTGSIGLSFTTAFPSRQPSWQSPSPTAAPTFPLTCSDVVDGNLFVAASVESITESAFRDCSSLTSVTFEPNSKLKTIEENAFRSSGLNSINLPASIETIARWAFDHCVLTSATFEVNSKLKTIADFAFFSSGITSISIPASVESIGVNAFYFCSQMTSVTFACSSKSLTIASNAFTTTSSFTSFSLPATATYSGYVSVETLDCSTPSPTAAQTEQPTQQTSTTTNTSGRKYCGGGQYVKDKKSDHESCEICPAGRFSKETTFRNRRCKKCKAGTYAHSPGAISCVKCPHGFNTKGRRGKKQCFAKNTGKSMKKLGLKLLSKTY